MLIGISDYAKMYSRNAMTVQQRCERGCFNSAVKIGRNWYIDEDEPFIDMRFSNSHHSGGVLPKKDIGEYQKIGIDDVLLADYAKLKGKGYKSQQQKALRGGFKTARLISNQWFIDKNE